VVTGAARSVSDLAAMRPENLVRQPSAMTFNVTMILAGLAIAVSAYLLQREGNGRRLTIPLALLGLGMVGVGFSLVVGLFLIDWAPVARLGEGGAERWAIYPVIFWVIALGVTLVTASGPTTRTPLA
jgi:hypothetical membrane protein